MNYENQICSGCGMPMHEGEDIVVCPECATPQHRDCYNKLHSCVNGYLHASGYVWQPNGEQAPGATPEQPENTVPPVENNSQPPQDIFCPYCGEKNTAGTFHCRSCGKMLPVIGQGQGPFGGFPPFMQGAPRDAGNPYLNETGINPDDNIGGEKAENVAIYVRKNTRKILPKCKAFSDNEKKHFSWNWAAFFLTPYYFFYRRMAKAGFLFMGILLALSLCLSPVVEKHFGEFLQSYSADMQAIYEGTEEGSSPDNAVTKGTSVKDAVTTGYSSQKTAEAFQKGVRGFLRDPLALGILAGQLLCRIFSALTADKTYYKKILHDLNLVRERSENDLTYQALLYRVGGVSLLSFLFGVFSFQIAGDMLARIADFFVQ